MVDNQEPRTKGILYHGILPPYWQSKLSVSPGGHHPTLPACIMTLPVALLWESSCLPGPVAR